MAKRGRGKGGSSGGGFGTGLVGLLLAAVILGGLANGTIRVPGTEPLNLPPIALPTWPGTAPAAPQPPPSAPEPPAPAAPSGHLAQLATLPVKGKAAKTGYSRDQFGPTWKDIDRNGCDTRNDILRRDLTNVTFKDNDGCTVVTGTLADTYTGKTIDFVRGQSTSTAVQIDHRIPLGNAWVTGAQQWDAAKREQFANDPLNLIAVDGPTNGSKSDRDAATWLPPNKGYRCQYVSAQIEVKAKYGLWVTQAERDAMQQVLEAC